MFLLRLKVTVAFFLFSSQVFSQSPSFQKLSCPEKCWVLLHPFAAKKAFRITVEARATSKQMESDSLLDHDADGGQVDAFRHAYWMSRLTQEMCWRKVRRLGNAHERGNYLDFKKHRSGEETFTDSIASAMDLFNNNVGLETGRMNKSLTKEEMKNLIVKKILTGEMKVILKDKNGNSLDCDKRIVDMKMYSGIWNIPRCLIRSDQVTK